LLPKQKPFGFATWWRVRDARAAFGTIALLFVFGVLELAEVAGWQTLRLRLPAIATTLVLLGFNLVIAAICGLLAARSSPSRVEREALHVRRDALHAARGTLSLAAVVPIGNTLFRHWQHNGRRRRALTGRS
jgi:hypothetical protein